MGLTNWGPGPLLLALGLYSLLFAALGTVDVVHFCGGRGLGGGAVGLHLGPPPRPQQVSAQTHEVLPCLLCACGAGRRPAP